MTTDYGLVAKALARVVDSVNAEVVEGEEILLETLSRFVGGFDFRRWILAENSVEFNLDLAGQEVETDALVADRSESANGLVTNNSLVRTKREQVTIYFPEAEEILKESFAKPHGGIQFVFVGRGFWKYLKAKNLMTDGRIGTARVVSRPKQPDRDVFLVSYLDSPVTHLHEIPQEKLARITVITKHPNLLQQMPQVGSGVDTQRVLSVSEQREYLFSMSGSERDEQLAIALENVSDGTAKSTLRNIFPEVPEEKLINWFYRTIRKIRPCAVKPLKPLPVKGKNPTEEEFMKEAKALHEKMERKESFKCRKLSLEELTCSAKAEPFPDPWKREVREGKVASKIGNPAVSPPTKVKSNKDIG